jgi:hypothetical protein
MGKLSESKDTSPLEKAGGTIFAVRNEQITVDLHAEFGGQFEEFGVADRPLLLEAQGRVVEVRKSLFLSLLVVASQAFPFGIRFLTEPPAAGYLQRARIQELQYGTTTHLFRQGKRQGGSARAKPHSTSPHEPSTES